MRKTIKFLLFMALSLIIHLGMSHMLSSRAAAPRIHCPVQVSLISLEAPEEQAAAEKPEEIAEKRKIEKLKPRAIREFHPREIALLPEMPALMSSAPLPAAEATDGLSDASETASGTIEAAPADSVPDTETILSLYRKQIIDIIRKNLKYPLHARRKGMEGRVRVSFTITGNGAVSAVEMVGSSGEQILDRAAVNTIRACSFPAPPLGALTLNVPITFQLVEDS